MDAFGGGRVKVRPPEKGVFPIDHDGECKEAMTIFLKCLKENHNDHFPCKNYSKAYLSCRMDRNLMAKEDLNDLGFGDKQYERKKADEGVKEATGFVAGLNVRGSKKGWFWS